MNSAACTSQDTMTGLPKPAQDNRLPPIISSPTSATSSRPRLPPLASIHQLPSQSHAPRLQNVSNVRYPNQSAPQLHNYLDGAFQRSTERMQAELVHFRAVCSRALHKEQQDKEALRMQCVSLMRERDAAREKVRTLMAQNGADGSPMLDEMTHPISPTSMSFPTSAGADGRQSFSLPPIDRRSPQSSSIDIHPDSPGQKRKSDIRSISGDPVLCASSQSAPVPNAPSFLHHKKRRMSVSSTSTSMNEPASPIDANHDHQVSLVDLMYMPSNGRLLCRACILKNRGDTARSRPDPSRPITPPTTFPLNASWDDLKDHCAHEHPSECADLASLSSAQLRELHRRFYASSTAPLTP